MTRIIFFVVFLTIGFIVYRFLFKKSVPNKSSHYKILSESPFFNESYYPINQTVDQQLYQPVAEWSGRLILPAERQKERFVEFEVQNAPDSHTHLLGEIVKLKWSKDIKVQEYVKRVSFDVNLSKEAKKNRKAGFIHPFRLDGLSGVDPLESLAGARPMDDVCVMLLQPRVETNATGETQLIIDCEPIQITGRFFGLVKIEARLESVGDLFRVTHYNQATRNFDKGIEEVICIPQVPKIPKEDGIARSTNKDIEKSPLNSQGWYIYGASDAKGTFVVKAIEPRALTKVKPQKVIVESTEALEYLNREMWAKTKLQKGSCQTVLLAPDGVNAETALSKWRLGDRALVMHLFGGIGGEKAEAPTWFPVTGHFSYGIAEVVRDRITSELRFDIVYHQVYAHNSQGIISGSITWAAYMGCLWRGWLGTRPVSDILVKYEPITTEYDFDGVKLSPLNEFISELQEIAARYRVGDGTGVSLVTPTTSCVQDSSQALYSTIYNLRRLVESNSTIREWLQKHAYDKQSRYFNGLISLGDALEKQLAPLGVVRGDWQQNANDLFGINKKNNNIIAIVVHMLRSWRSILPKRAQDETAQIFLQQGAIEWVLRTNQVGGFDDTILPLAPTTIFKALKIIMPFGRE
ncbi:MAG: abortive infection protein [Cyanobacteria bacterium J06635_10]